jgi:hypothetical protein
MVSPTSPLRGSWNVSFATFEDLDQGDSVFLDGVLKLWKRDWLALEDSHGCALEGRYLRPNEQISEGATLDLPSHRIRILGRVSSSPEVHVSGKIISPSSPDDLVVNAQCWKITYSTLKDLDRNHMKAYDGTLFYFPMDHWLVLRNAKGSRIGCRFLLKGESLSLGAKLSFKQHVVRIGSWIRSDTPVHIEKSTKIVCMPSSGHASSSKTVPSSALFDLGTQKDVTSLVLDSISMGLDYSHGSNFAKEIGRLFKCYVHPSEQSGHFTMVVSFGRAKFKLEEDLVGIALESAIGGYCGNLKVSRLGERVFSFCVANKGIGFHILKLRKYSCPQFKCYFHLWGRAGPNWKHEFSLWSKENEQEWTLVSPRKRQISMAMAALKTKPSKSIV